MDAFAPATGTVVTESESTCILNAPPGRAIQIKELQLSVEDGLRGDGRFLVISGEPGIGKTNLVRCACNYARRRGMAVFWTTCRDGSAAPPYVPWLQIVRDCTHGPLAPTTQNEEDDSCMGPADHLSRLAHRCANEALSPSALADERVRLFDLTKAVVMKAAQIQPVFIVIDNLQNADDLTLSALPVIGPQARIAPIVLVGMCTQIPKDQAIARAILRESDHLQLHRLSKPGIAEVLHTLIRKAPDPETLSFVERLTDGNPLLIREIAFWLWSKNVPKLLEPSAGEIVPHAAISGAACEYLQMQIDALPPGVTEKLRLAASLGCEFQMPLLGQTESKSELSQALADAERAGIIRKADGERDRYSFVQLMMHEFLCREPISKGKPDSQPASRNTVSSAERRVPGDFLPQIDSTVSTPSEKAELQSEVEQKQSIAPDDLSVPFAKVPKPNTLPNEHRQHGRNHPVAQSQRSMQRHGEYWTINYQGTVFSLRSSKGLVLIARLIRFPRRQFHAVDLIEMSERIVDPQDAPVPVPKPRETDNCGPVLDVAAKMAYRERVQDLQNEIEQANTANDLAQTSKLQQELEFLIDELARATGLHGRDRHFQSNSERARIRVTNAIRIVEKKMFEHCRPLANHLSNALKTGTVCSYSPESASDAEWHVSE